MDLLRWLVFASGAASAAGLMAAYVLLLVRAVG